MTERPHLLIVEDEPAIRTPLQRYLEREGFRVTAVGDAAGARETLPKGAFAMVILDIMLPGEDGLSLARHIRSQGSLPILFLSAKAEDIDRIVGLEMGADDYLTKPFNPRELLARVKAILRRSDHEGHSAPNASLCRFDRFTLDSARQTLSDDEGPIDLTSGEYRLLRVLVERPGRVLSRDQLLDLTKGREAGPFDRSVDNAVMRLRRKLGEDGADLIRTVHGAGYCLAADVERG
ncbi:response regulator [Sphingomicrobium lutaoense]|uniref:Regulatory protein VirG n=1 Tax=Sphingomicrobium lutaoense TaxID=515949 RepID=A0A839YXD1_9SPHN|nr:response regulator transcription factor [Sphingomicrobium lutaoense]MBB3763140.1 two-component system OmpR family response regulator [Sphingomicrobium lutaoense]